DAVLATFNPTPEAVEAWEERVRRLAAYDDMLAALKAANRCLSRTLKCRGYVPGSCTDEWSAEVRLEVRTAATVSAAIAAATSGAQPPV
ncbi:hypothetical protein, partial [Enterobacter roggenkampii]|uniref:hypothetical protein n=1 Tax=Enterobacter roggenkampii TaxID=1812935 RepID=UPI001952D72B